jgi:hypothetical protein
MPNYNTPYMNNYGSYYPQQNYQQPTYNYSYQNQMPSQIGQQAQQTTFMQLTFVNGLEEAKSYIVAPNSSIYLRDNNSNKLYIKSCDNTGRSSLEEYNLVKSTEKGSNSSESVDYSRFVTTSAFQSMKDEFTAKFEEIEKKLGGTNE